ncbi:hypothetical protein DCC81_04170 [Chitinophaga parva]|uniref:FecR protein domain-containing protein n=1 Tax=Chitinophaga parva TaxID=2169414 RepID=A0A2T7BLY1_9BACT|nr:FecR domain-containing protein [Chitinophaga parva]PUZ28688.1 hypothetical protein DCC81_04170 [Chitinophaga parva]
MTPERLQYLLEKYLDGTATEAERQAYDEWYEARQHDTDAALTPMELRQVYQRIAHRTTPARVVRMRWATAAAVSGAMVLGAAWWWQQPHHQAAVSPVAQAISAPADTLEFENKLADHRSVHLPDGSLATLYKGSRIRYSSGFGKQDRRIILFGKAYFNVARYAGNPFVVESGNVATTALGTAFTMARTGSEIKVWLHSGRVMVQANNRIAYLQPGQMAISTPTAALLTMNSESSGNATPALKRATIRDFGGLTGYAASFDQLPLSQVLDSLAKGYHINIRVQHASLENIAFSGTVRPTDSLAQVLHRIALLENLKITNMATGYRIEKNH